MGPTNYFPTEEAKEQPPHSKFPRSHALCYKLDKLRSYGTGGEPILV